MDFKIESSHILYGLGAILGIFTLIYFGLEVILSLSPVTKSFMLLAGSAAFFFLSEVMDEDLLRTILYGFSGFSYLVFTGYTLAKFDLSSEATFLFLAGSSALFIFLGHKVSEGGFKLSKMDYRHALIGLAAFSALLLVVDILGAQPTHSVEVRDTVELSTGQNVVGTYTVSNSFVLPRDVDTRRYSACIYTEGEREQRTFSGVEWPDSTPEILRYGESVTANLTANLPRVDREHDAVNLSGTYEVELEESCPENVEGEKVIVAESNID